MLRGTVCGPVPSPNMINGVENPGEIERSNNRGAQVWTVVDTLLFHIYGAVAEKRPVRYRYEDQSSY